MLTPVPNGPAAGPAALPLAPWPVGGFPPAVSRRPEPAGRRRASFDFGIRAEGMVAQFLRAGNYEILARRARVGPAEIDIVACRDDVYAFVEVKARTRGHDGYYAIDRRKQARIVAAAEMWLAARPGVPFDAVTRFDMALVWPGGKLDYVENAFGTVELEEEYVW